MLKRKTSIIAAALFFAAPAAAQEVAEPTLEFVFEEVVALGAPIAPGQTSRGGRLMIPITGGTFEGPALKGTVVPAGWDWQLTRADGCTDVEADYFLLTDDGVYINVINTGALCPPREGEAPSPVRTHPVFEAPIGKYDWLNRSTFIGTLDLAPSAEGMAVRIRFYRVR